MHLIYVILMFVVNANTFEQDFDVLIEKYVSTSVQIKSKRSSVGQIRVLDENMVKPALPAGASYLIPFEKPGLKAWQHCMLFQNILTYLCKEAVKQSRLDEWFNSIFYGRTKSNGYDIDGGTDAKSLEFPYTALLGYGDDAETREWLCGGAVISSYFILTAGHCTYSRDFGSVTQVSVGLLRRSEQLQFYKIKNIIRHPDYHPPSKYNDIALLKTEQKIQYNLNVLPACLHSGFPVSDEYATAVGWGALGYIRKNADVLQKVKLQKFTRVECSKEYPAQRLLKFGVNYTTQICYGDYKQKKDTCQGDSGGPLIAEHSKFPCLQSIVGITSFGKPCGMGGRPGIYTRVAPYVPWIESVVWPCD